MGVCVCGGEGGGVVGMETQCGPPVTSVVSRDAAGTGIPRDATLQNLQESRAVDRAVARQRAVTRGGGGGLSSAASAVGGLAGGSAEKLA